MTTLALVALALGFACGRAGRRGATRTALQQARVEGRCEGYDTGYDDATEEWDAVAEKEAELAWRQGFDAGIAVPFCGERLRGRVSPERMERMFGGTQTWN